MADAYPAARWSDVPAAVAALYPRALARRDALPAGASEAWWDPAADAYRPAPAAGGGAVLLKRAAWPASPATLLEDASAALGRPLGGPNALTHALVGAALGSGLGAAGGALLEASPAGRRLARGRARRSGLLLGGLLGAAPGLIGGVARAGVPGLLPGVPAAGDGWWGRFTSRYGWRDKASADRDAGGPFGGPPIPVDAFNRVVWDDVLDGRTRGRDAAAVSGLLAATAVREGRATVSPWEVASTVATGLGAGYGAGMLAGQALGALVGLGPDERSALRRAGAFGGVIAGVARLASGR